VGEQLDGAIKHDGTYYIVALTWFADKLDPHYVGAFHFKVDGKIGARGIVIALNDYTDSVMATLPTDKELKLLLLDGNQLANVVYGHYKFEDLLNHAIRQATLNGQPYCPHQLQ
jgi:hypothetical protein